MCYNCGCGLPNDPMGKKIVSEGGSSLVEKDFKKMADGWGMSLEDTKKEVLKMLQKEVVVK